MDKHRLAIVIPAYNESKTIAQVVNKVKNFGTPLVIDDCSLDETGKIAEENGATVFQRDKNYGYEAALNYGFCRAQDLGFNYVITFDADDQHDANMIEKFSKKMIDEEYALVIGCRPSSARIGEFLISRYCRFRFGISDILCGMKGYNINLLSITGTGHFDRIGSLGTELTILSIKEGKKYYALPVPIKAREDKPRVGSTIKVNLKLFKILIKIILLDLKLRRAYEY